METFRFQLLRYVPDSIKNEFVNIGVVLLDDLGRSLGVHMASETDLRRVRCVHPGADLELLRSWQATVEDELAHQAEGAGVWLRSLEEVASHSLRWTSPAGCQVRDAPVALQELYERFVASPPRAAVGARAGTAAWVKREVDSVFRAAGLLEHFQSGVWAQRFTCPGDPFRIHYAYSNGTPRYIHMLSLEHSIQQAKVLTFTFERIQRSGPAALTSVVEPEPRPIPTVQFTRQLLEQSGIEVLTLDRIQGLVRRAREELRLV